MSRITVWKRSTHPISFPAQRQAARSALWLSWPGMHGHGSQADAPASDAATREGRRRPRVRAASCRIGPTQLKSASTRRKSAPTRPKSGRLGPYWPVSAETAKSGRNSKKKKKKMVQTHRLTNLNTQTPLRPSHFVQHSQKSYLTPSLISLLCVLRSSSLFSVFQALCECYVHTALLQPSGVLSLLFS